MTRITIRWVVVRLSRGLNVTQVRTDDIVVMEMDSDGKEKLEASKKRKASSVIRNSPGKRARNIKSTSKKGKAKTPQ